MAEKVAIIKARHGLHARPSSAIYNVAKTFKDTSIILMNAQRKEQTDAKSILGILMMGKKCGDTIIVQATGIDEERAAEAVAKVIAEFDIA